MFSTLLPLTHRNNYQLSYEVMGILTCLPYDCLICPCVFNFQPSVPLITSWGHNRIPVVGRKMALIILTGRVLMVLLLAIKLGHHLTTPMELNKVSITQIEQF